MRAEFHELLSPVRHSVRQLAETLQPVYLTNTHGNQRGDVLRLAQATAVLAPNAMAVPLSDKGKPTLKLDTLAPANGFAHENAHDALADVEATIYMARHIRDRAPAVWASLMPMVDKGDVTPPAFCPAGPTA